MPTITLNGCPYTVKEGECPQRDIEEFCNLKIYPELGKAERLVGLLCEIAEEVFGSAAAERGKVVLEVHGWRLGGFIPLECARRGLRVRVVTEGEPEILFPCPEGLEIVSKSSATRDKVAQILFVEGGSDAPASISWPQEYFLLAPAGAASSTHIRYALSDTGYELLVPVTRLNAFFAAFFHFIDNSVQVKPLLRYDNLLHLVIMVKNAGPGFEDVLKRSLPHIDRWTVLDTGSTDGTQDVAKRVLGACRPGRLYEEPFVNFRESRNRSLELAGTKCKYVIVLDDTYWIGGPLRQFLNTVRGDQYATSYSSMILSGDSEYYSNRILKTAANLRYIYTIHEVIQFDGNTNVVIPKEHGHLVDECSPYMEERTKDRKFRDIELLEGMVKEDPDNPRHLYYLAQTYKCLGDFAKTEEYFRRRIEFPNPGFLQEKVDACFELARLMNFELGRPWEACKAMYEQAYALEPSRPDPLYFIGIYYYTEGNRPQAFEYFKRAISIGYPIHTQFSLKPTLFFHFLPKFLVQLCYEFEAYELGEKTAELFLKHNKPDADSYGLVADWYKIFKNLVEAIKASSLKPLTITSAAAANKKLILAFIADGGWGPWTGRDILTKGVGGSETYIIEMARHIQGAGTYDVQVFCNCVSPDTFEGVQYIPLKDLFASLSATQIEHCIVSRFSEYVPACIWLPTVKKVSLVLHDLGPSGNIIPIHPKLESIFCLTEWHRRHFLETFPQFESRTYAFGYGIDAETFADHNGKPCRSMAMSPRFIYSSFPNRGLLPLLRMWPRIQEEFPTAALHIFSDLSGAWVNQVAGEEIRQIRVLLAAAKSSSGQRIYEHGWVSKNELAAAWATTDVWFYPCTFKETYCLTAAEAAASKALAVTNALAALENTVGDRGLAIPGDPMDPAWQDKALTALFSLLRDPVRVKNFVESNYSWAAERSWKAQATLFQEKYLSRGQVNFANMYNWTNDLPQGSRHFFEEAFDIAMKGAVTASPQILEIGVYAGTSLLSMLATAPPTVHATAIDRWEDYDEFGNPVLGEMKSRGIEQIFYDNVASVGAQDRITALKGDSVERLLDLVRQGKTYDFIYVDGSHKCIDCYTDMALAWRLLLPGGVLAVDDYLFRVEVATRGGDPLATPFYGVEHFLEKYAGQYTVISKEYRVFLQKR